MYNTHAEFLQLVMLYLGLDGVLLAVGLQPGTVHLTVKVANVAADGVVLHGHEVLGADDLTASRGRHKDVGPSHSIVNSGHLVACTGGRSEGGGREDGGGREGGREQGKEEVGEEEGGGGGGGGGVREGGGEVREGGGEGGGDHMQ